MSVNYSYDHNSSVFLSHAKAEKKYLSPGFEDHTLLKFGAKKFIGNSTYYKAGIYQLISDAKYYKRDKNSIYQTQKTRFKDYGLSVSIGNQWQWKHFSFAVNWIGINQTFYETKKLMHPYKRITYLTLSALNLSFGYSF